MDSHARRKRRGFSPAAAARHLNSTTTHTDGCFEGSNVAVIQVFIFLREEPTNTQINTFLRNLSGWACPRFWIKSIFVYWTTGVSRLIFWFISKHRVEPAQVGSYFSNNPVEPGEFDWIFGQIGVELNVILRRWKLENTEMTRLTPSKRPQNADFAHKSSGFGLSWAFSRVDCSRVDFSRVD